MTHYDLQSCSHTGLLHVPWSQQKRWGFRLGWTAGRKSKEIKTSSWHHQDPGSNLSWSPIYHWTLQSSLIPFPFSFLSFHQPFSHPAFVSKSGSSSIKDYVPLLTISQRLSEKCYSQKPSLQRLWFYSRVQQKLKKSYSWHILGEFMFTNIQEQLNMTCLKFNVAVIFSLSLQYLLRGYTHFSISPSLYICF